MSYDDQGFKYLAVKNWERYQVVDRKGRLIKRYIHDYCDKDGGDRDYARLTVTQRYYMDAVCRLRGRLGCNVANDPLFVGRALAILPQERHNLGAVLKVLVSCGLLALTNEKFSLSDSDSDSDSDSETDTEADAGAPRPAARASSKAKAEPEPAWEPCPLEDGGCGYGGGAHHKDCKFRAGR